MNLPMRPDVDPWRVDGRHMPDAPPLMSQMTRERRCKVGRQFARGLWPLAFSRVTSLLTLTSVEPAFGQPVTEDTEPQPSSRPESGFEASAIGAPVLAFAMVSSAS